MLVGVFVFRVPFRGSLPLLAVSTCVFLFGALFWGIFISAVAKTQVAAYQMGILSSFLPAFLLSGFVYSIETMPWVIQVITHIVPARYLVTILKGIFLKGVGLSVLWGELGFLALYAVIVFLLATRKLNQKLAVTLCGNGFSSFFARNSSRRCASRACVCCCSCRRWCS